MNDEIPLPDDLGLVADPEELGKCGRETISELAKAPGRAAFFLGNAAVYGADAFTRLETGPHSPDGYPSPGVAGVAWADFQEELGKALQESTQNLLSTGEFLSRVAAAYVEQDVENADAADSAGGDLSAVPPDAGNAM